jgi:hypothetical protein
LVKAASAVDGPTVMIALISATTTATTVTVTVTRPRLGVVVPIAMYPSWLRSIQLPEAVPTDLDTNRSHLQAESLLYSS